MAVKVNIYLVGTSDFAAMNEVYTSFFPDPKPVSSPVFVVPSSQLLTECVQARTCVFVKALPLGTDVEIECTARRLGLDRPNM